MLYSVWKYKHYMSSLMIILKNTLKLIRWTKYWNSKLATKTWYYNLTSNGQNIVEWILMRFSIEYLIYRGFIK